MILDNPCYMAHPADESIVAIKQKLKCILHRLIAE
jgi:hypothetical protein